MYVLVTFHPTVGKVPLPVIVAGRLLVYPTREKARRRARLESRRGRMTIHIIEVELTGDAIDMTLPDGSIRSLDNPDP